MSLHPDEPPPDQPVQPNRYSKRFVRGWLDLFSLILKVRFWILLGGHALVFLATAHAAFSLRFEFQWTPSAWKLFASCVPVMIAVKLACFYYFRSFHGWWRYVVFSDLHPLGKATLASLFTLVLLDHFVLTYQIPRSILIIDAILTIVALGLVRSSWRLLHEEVRPRLDGNRRFRCAVVGVSDTAVRLASQLRSSPNLGHEVVGLIAPEHPTSRTWVASFPVLGALQQLSTVLPAYRIDELLVPAGEISGAKMRQLASEIEKTPRRLRVIPRVEDFLKGNGTMPLREVDINDLLRREPVELDSDAIAELTASRRVLVTGAGGSIGSEICRQVIQYGPRELYLLGRGENRIFAIEQELRGQSGPTSLVPLIADITDRERMRSIFETYRPEIVFHAAAHKHVPLMEANVGEAVRNNILGTMGLADLADEYASKAFVLISTDKAVNPTSVMGTTKHLAERYVNSISVQSPTRFIVVRFGNVLGSAGSVVPTFREQISKGGPVTITDERMRRYFMTIPEASRLVLQAAAMGKGGEIFVLDMGEPVRIVDLARDMIRLSGLQDESIEIKFTGIRPGEKLYEELYFSDESSLPTQHPKLRAARHREHPWDDVRRSFEELASCNLEDQDSLRAQLAALVPEYGQQVRARTSSHSKSGDSIIADPVST